MEVMTLLTPNRPAPQAAPAPKPLAPPPRRGDRDTYVPAEPTLVDHRVWKPTLAVTGAVALVVGTICGFRSPWTLAYAAAAALLVGVPLDFMYGFCHDSSRAR